MKSLEERRAYRAQQEENRKKASQENGEAQPSDEEFDAAAWVADSVDNIKAAIGELSDEELNAVEAAEKNGKDRVGVNSAIADERAKRGAAATGWAGGQA